MWQPNFWGVIHHQQKKPPEKPKRDIKPLGRCISLPYKNKSMEGNHTVCAYFYFIYFYANQAMAGKFVVNSCAG